MEDLEEAARPSVPHLLSPSLRGELNTWNHASTASKNRAAISKGAATARKEFRKGKATQRQCRRFDWLLEQQSIDMRKLWTGEFGISVAAAIMSEICYIHCDHPELLKHYRGSPHAWVCHDIEEVWRAKLDCTYSGVQKAINKLVKEGYLFKEIHQAYGRAPHVWLRPDPIKVLAVQARHGEKGNKEAELRAGDLLAECLGSAYESETDWAKDDTTPMTVRHGAVHWLDRLARGFRERRLQPRLGDFPLNERPMSDDLRERRDEAASRLAEGTLGRVLRTPADKKRKVSKAPARAPRWALDVENDLTLPHEKVEPLSRLIESYTGAPALKRASLLTDMRRLVDTLRTPARTPKIRDNGGFSCRRDTGVENQATVDMSLKISDISTNRFDSGQSPECIYEEENTTPYGVVVVPSLQSGTTTTPKVVEPSNESAPSARVSVKRNTTVFFPALTKLLREARERNWKFAPGVGVTLPNDNLPGEWFTIGTEVHARIDPFHRFPGRRGLFTMHFSEGCVWVKTSQETELPEEFSGEASEKYVARRQATPPATPAS